MDVWWEPSPFYYWPDDVPREYTLAAYSSAYRKLGYRECDSAALEPNIGKIALFVDEQGKPTHAARQLESGQWTSKLGPNVDIEHELHALEGEQYGSVTIIMKRPIRS